VQLVNQKFGLHLQSYEDLYSWSIENVGEFWGEVWNFVGVRAAKEFDEVSVCISSRHVLSKYLSQRSG